MFKEHKAVGDQRNNERLLLKNVEEDKEAADTKKTAMGQVQTLQGTHASQHRSQRDQI